MARFGARGPELQTAMFASGQLPELSEIERVSDLARSLRARVIGHLDVREAHFGGGALQMYVPQLVRVSRNPCGTISAAMKTRFPMTTPIE
jgi:hypothetical protein